MIVWIHEYFTTFSTVWPEYRVPAAQNRRICYSLHFYTVLHHQPATCTAFPEPGDNAFHPSTRDSHLLCLLSIKLPFLRYMKIVFMPKTWRISCGVTPHAFPDPNHPPSLTARRVGPNVSPKMWQRLESEGNRLIEYPARRNKKACADS